MKALALILLFAITSLNYSESVTINKHGITFDCSTVSKSNFKLYISLDTNYYLYGEPIWLKVKVINEGKMIDSIENLYESELLQSVQILNGTGEVLEYNGLIGCFGTRSYSVFLPGEAKDFSFELRHVYGNKSALAPRTAFGLRRLFDEDPYSLYLKMYKADSKKYLTSNHIYFNVVKPDEKEYDAFQNLLKIYSMPDYTHDLANNKKAELKMMLIELTDSKYYFEAFKNYMYLRYFNQDTIYGSIAPDLYLHMDNFPNDKFSSSYVWHYHNAFTKNGGEKQISFQNLKLLKNRHPETKIFSAIVDFLKSNQIEK